MSANHRLPSPLLLWRDAAPRSAAWQMALDEALFDHGRLHHLPLLRCYTWQDEAVTVGYFHQGPLPPQGVRRMTGGGLVEHGADLTFCLVLPAEAALSSLPTAERYHGIHHHLAAALQEAGLQVHLGEVTSAASSHPCFVHPVQWDVIDPHSGLKIAGGAQRKSRGAVIHQGSVRVPDALRSVEAGWVTTFATALAGLQGVAELCPEMRERLLVEAQELHHQRYNTPAWNHPQAQR